MFSRASRAFVLPMRLAPETANPKRCIATRPRNMADLRWQHKLPSRFTEQARHLTITSVGNINQHAGGST